MVYTDQKCDRRAFLIKSMKFNAAVCLSYAMPATIISCSNDQKNDVAPDHFYISKKTKLLKDLDKAVESGQDVLVKSLGESLTREVLIDARKEYEIIILEIPYIGGEQNNNSTSQLLLSAQSLALYRVLIANGMEIKEVGQLIYDMFKAMLQSSPQIIVSVWGYFKFHVGWNEKIKKYAAMSQKRAYPMDFVYTFIEGDGKELDYGVNMTECAIQKFLRKQNAEDLVPYMCALDNPLSRRFNRGLIRTKTLVESNVCDFRYKKDRETQINLPPELKV